MVASNATPRAQTTARESWGFLLDGESVQAVTLEDGQLDVQAFTQRLSTQLRQPDNLGYIRGAMPKIPGATVFYTYPSGGNQLTRDYARSGQNGWNLQLCNLPHYGNGIAIGCGPASFAGLLDFQFRYRGKVIQGRRWDSKNDWDSRQGMLYWLTAPVTSNKVPLIANYMGTCWFGDGALTRAKYYVNVAKGFLRDHAPTLRLLEQKSNGVFNGSNAGAKLDLLKWAMWRSSAGWPTSSSSEVPVVAQYFFSVGRAHFAAIREWRFKRVGLMGQLLEVRTENHPNIWTNLADTFNYETGVYAIY